MPVREYQESDLAHLRAIHAKQGFDYALPDLSNPLFVTKKVLARQRRNRRRSLSAPHCRAYLLLDPGARHAARRWQWLLALHAAAEHDAWQPASKTSTLGCRRPSPRNSASVIAQLGWIRDDAWTPYCKRLRAAG